jgi:hypothetical protein
VPSVRLLSGTTYRGYPIRHAKEVANFIRTGRGHIVLSGKDYELDFWRGRSFSAALLIEYLSRSNSVYAPVWGSVTEGRHTIHVGRTRIVRPVYFFDQAKHLKALTETTPPREVTW